MKKKPYVPYEESRGSDPCPWCGTDSSAYVDGSYVEGWVAYVKCYHCDARGPTKRSGSYSNDECAVLEQAIVSWNMINTTRETKHGECRTAYYKSRGTLEKLHGYVDPLTVGESTRGYYYVKNIYGHIWDGKACCKWRARANAAKVLVGRDKLRGKSK
jgi:hypothetical protein